MQRFPQGLFKPGTKLVAGLLLDFLTVHSDEELSAALADGWFESPEDAVRSKREEVKEEQEAAQEVLTGLEALAKKKGLKIDKRWSEARLRRELGL